MYVHVLHLYVYNPFLMAKWLYFANQIAQGIACGCFT